MNPFELEQEEVIIVPKNIEIWVETAGRKKNTYISGLTYSSDELKTHLKNLRKKLACNGSLQTKEDSNQTMLHFQGDHSVHIKEYFTELGIKNIITKGV